MSVVDPCNRPWELQDDDRGRIHSARNMIPLSEKYAYKEKTRHFASSNV